MRLFTSYQAVSFLQIISYYNGLPPDVRASIPSPQMLISLIVANLDIVGGIAIFLLVIQMGGCISAKKTRSLINNRGKRAVPPPRKGRELDVLSASHHESMA
jgi:hypothetical protein